MRVRKWSAGFSAWVAAGTIAKSMSAYDMKVSDAIYGECDRYVSRRRLEDMLKIEHELNLERLRDQRGDTTAFFAFADTVSGAELSWYQRLPWLDGNPLPAHPRDQTVRSLSMFACWTTTTRPSKSAGIVGVNLLYGAFFLHHEPERLLESLLDNSAPAASKST